MLMLPHRMSNHKRSSAGAATTTQGKINSSIDPHTEVIRLSDDMDLDQYPYPEPYWLHQDDPYHALGGGDDHVGTGKQIKQFEYYQSTHPRTRGTTTIGHTCSNCSRVFSRVGNLIDHRAACKARTMKAPPPPPAYCNLLQASSYHAPEFSSFTTSNSTIPRNLRNSEQQNNQLVSSFLYNVKLQQFNSSSPPLKLSIGSPSNDEGDNTTKEARLTVSRLKKEALEELQIAMEEKALADEKIREARWHIQLAEQDLAKAKRIRHQAIAELNHAQVLMDNSVAQMKCHACRTKFDTYHT